MISSCGINILWRYWEWTDFSRGVNSFDKTLIRLDPLAKWNYVRESLQHQGTSIFLMNRGYRDRGKRYGALGTLMANGYVLLEGTRRGAQRAFLLSSLLVFAQSTYTELGQLHRCQNMLFGFGGWFHLSFQEFNKVKKIVFSKTRISSYLKIQHQYVYILLYYCYQCTSTYKHFYVRTNETKSGNGNYKYKLLFVSAQTHTTVCFLN